MYGGEKASVTGIKSLEEHASFLLNLIGSVIQNLCMYVLIRLTKI